MTTAERMAGVPAGAIEGARCAEIIGQLNASLANMIDLSHIAKQAHWNVRGPNFQGLHELFDTIAAETRAWSDLLAERAVTLGGQAHGTTQDVAGSTKLQAFPTDETRWQNLCRETHQRMMTCAKDLRTFAKNMDDELVTQDLCIEIIRGLEMRAWMVEAHLDRSGM